MFLFFFAAISLWKEIKQKHFSHTCSLKMYDINWKEKTTKNENEKSRKQKNDNDKSRKQK